MSVRNWKSFYKKEEWHSRKENIVDTVCLWCAVGLLWYAAVSMIQEKFPNFIEAVIYSDTEGIPVLAGNFRLMKMEWGIILLWLLILWIGSDWVKTYLKKWSIVFSFAGIAIPLFYITANAEKLFAGAAAILQEYLQYWNAYYGTAFFLASGNTSYAPMAFSVMLMLLWWVIWNIAYAVKKRMLLSLFPIILLILELIVGKSPRGAGLYCLFLGAVLLLNLGGTAIGKKVFVIAGTAGSLLICSLCFGERVDWLTTEEKKQEVLAWQDSLLSVDFHFSKEALGNQTPIYTGEVILEIETDSPPETSIYLRGFYGTNYKNGIWTYDDREFQELCQKYSYSEEELVQYLFSMPYDAVCNYYGENNLRVPESEYVIHYVGSTGDVAYVPYFSQYDSLGESYTFMGDYLLKKSVWENRLSVKAVQSNIHADVLKQLGGEETVSKEIEVLNELSSSYCVNQEKFAFFEQAVQEIKGNEEIKTVDSVDGRNTQRLALAQKVKQYLSEKMSYSLILDELPNGADPMEYALLQGHEGYCMHFASAGTVLLRELGVPARYVSGYVVNPSDFTAVEGRYLAEVEDYAAHAWVEIYLENVGWIPYEMTPGYSAQDSIPTEGDKEVYEEQSEERREQIEQAESELESEQESEDSSQETEQEDTQLATENESNDETEEESGREDSTEDDGIDEGNGNDDVENNFQINKGILKGFIGILCFFLIAAGIYLGFRKFIVKYENSLYSEVKRGLTRRAVKRINKRMYRMLRLKSGKSPEKNQQKGYWTDVRMEEELIACYDFVDKEDWERYMDIVKKMHYSLEDISREEMQYCYKCYKRVWELTFCKQITDMIQDKYKTR